MKTKSFEIDSLDPQTVYCLTFAEQELGDIEQAQKHFQLVLEMEATENLCGLARKGLSKIAAREPQARGPRMDAVIYLLNALRLLLWPGPQNMRYILDVANKPKVDPRPAANVRYLKECADAA